MAEMMEMTKKVLKDAFIDDDSEDREECEAEGAAILVVRKSASYCLLKAVLLFSWGNVHAPLVLALPVAVP
jgi:hypothetical protein